MNQGVRSHFILARICGFYLILAVTLFASSATAKEEQLRIGSKKFTENVILGDIAQLLLAAEGFDAYHQKELGGTRILWEALRRGDLDLYPEYTGTLQFEILQLPKLNSLQDLQKALAQHGVGITLPLGFNNSYSLGMRRKQAKDLGISRISDLSNHPQLVYGLSHEFTDRADGWPGLKQSYGLDPQIIRGVDHDIGYRGIAFGSLDVVDIYTTDAEIELYDLVSLEDDLNYFPRYEAVYVYRHDLSKSAITALKRLAGSISESEMVAMNASAKGEGLEAAVIAGQFLKESFDIDSDIVVRNIGEIIKERSYEHLFLVFMSMTAAIILAVPLGYLAAYSIRFGQIILAVVGIIQTIPSLALLVIMVPIFGIGVVPALFALFLYSLLPIVRGTYLGFRSITQSTQETAEAIGLSKGARFRFIYWPMALSSILSGIKTSAVINVGTATLGALIGAGGYGQTILRGIRLDDTQLILAGAIPAAILALLVQWSFDAIERLTVSKGLRL